MLLAPFFALMGCDPAAADSVADSGGDDTAADVLPEPDLVAENILENPDYFATGSGASRVDTLMVFSYEDGVPVFGWFGYALDNDGLAPMNCAVGYTATVKNTDIDWCDMYCDAGGTFVTSAEQEVYGDCGNVALPTSAEEDFERVQVEAGYQELQKRGPTAEYHEVIMVGGSSVTTFATEESEGFNDGQSWAAHDGTTLWIYGREHTGDVI